MERNTVKQTVDAGLCTGCGICAGVCPRASIRWEFRDGMYFPRIEEDTCVGCGLCAKLCPGLGHRYEPAADAASAVTGPVIASFNAWSRDAQIRHISASGGVVSTLVRTLLEKGCYDSVFCLDTYDYREQLRTRRYTREDFLSGSGEPTAPKSRYLPASHEEAVRYLLAHRQERIIFIATSCALRGLTAVIDQKKLERENYLLVGLFCDKIFTYNVLPYFQDRFCGGAPLEQLHFKNKESGGWPGDMKLFPEGQDSRYVSKDERAKAKRYFMPERCLYCVDKLNASADISLGDNYTGIDSSEKGSNSVILRTPRGQAAWELALDRLEVREVDIPKIQSAQYLDGRLNNLYFSDLKAATVDGVRDLNPGVPRKADASEYQWAWKQELTRIATGACYDRDTGPLNRQMKCDGKKPNPALTFLRRVIRFLKRKLC